MLLRRGHGKRIFRFRPGLVPALAPPPRVPELRPLPFDLSAAQDSQKRQGSDAAAPRQLDEQHQREPLQAETFDDVFATGADRIAIATQAVDLLSAPPLNRVIRADHHNAIGRQQQQQQAEQNPARLQSAPARPIEHAMIILKSFLLAQPDHTQTSRDRALAPRQQRAHNNKTLACSQNGLKAAGKLLSDSTVRQVVSALGSHLL